MFQGTHPFNAIKLNIDGSYRRYHALVTALTKQADDFIDAVLPPTLKEANQLYKDYYQIQKQLGTKILDSSGEVKKGAETFLGNIMNLNKGEERQAVEEAGKKLGIDILDEAGNLKIAKDILADTASSVKNRTMDILKGVLGGAGLLIKPSITIPAIIISILSNPKVYGGLIEIIAGASRNMPITEALKTLKPEEMILIQNLFKSLIPRRNNSSSQPIEE